MVKSKQKLKAASLPLILLGVLALLGASVAVFFYLSSSDENQETPVVPAQQKSAAVRGSYDVHLKQDPKDPRMTIVYLYDAKANVETRFMTLPDVYRDDYHPAEFVEGTLYVIRRTTGSDNPANTNWTDELWEYDQSAAGSKVYSAKGLDFRVSPDGKEIAVLHGDTAGSFALIDSVGNVLKILAGKDLRGFGQGKMLNPLFWHGGVLWLTANQGPQITDIYAFDTAVMVLSAYPIADFGVILNESAVEPASRTLAFGDYNPDVEHAAPRMSTLSVYDLATKKKVVIVAATVSRPFAPKWVDGSTVEYNDPHGSGRTTFSTFGIFKK